MPRCVLSSISFPLQNPHHRPVIHYETVAPDQRCFIIFVQHSLLIILHTCNKIKHLSVSPAQKRNAFFQQKPPLFRYVSPDVVLLQDSPIEEKFSKVTGLTEESLGKHWCSLCKQQHPLPSACRPPECAPLIVLGITPCKWSLTPQNLHYCYCPCISFVYYSSSGSHCVPGTTGETKGLAQNAEITKNRTPLPHQANGGKLKSPNQPAQHSHLQNSSRPYCTIALLVFIMFTWEQRSLIFCSIPLSITAHNHPTQRSIAKGNWINCSFLSC